MKRNLLIFIQIVVVLIGIGVFVFMLWEPHLEGRNAQATLFEIYFKDPFLACAYIASIAFFVGIHQAFKALGYARQDKTFSQETVKALRTIRFCAIIIIGFVVAGVIFILRNHGNDDPAGGIAIGILITLGSIVTALVARMLERRVIGSEKFVV